MKMENNNWQEIENIFHQALGLEIKERGEYLLRSCAGDDLLRSEVESLLASSDSCDALLENPIFGTGMELMGQAGQASLCGKVIGSYLIEKMLGAGGMGDVYLAHDMRLERQVALKFLSNAFVNDVWAKRQFVKEARAAAMLNHPNICAVYGFEEAENFSFIVMQYVEGQTLAQLIAENEIEQINVPAIINQILEALATAHSHGIIHRDIKPSNIIVTSDGHVKVVDFGLAKIIHAKNSETAGLNQHLSQASQKGLIAGTISYMSPEQLRGDKLDFRSDIFSLGIVTFEVVTGQRPFTRDSDAETIFGNFNGPASTVKMPELPAGD